MHHLLFLSLLFALLLSASASNNDSHKAHLIRRRLARRKTICILEGVAAEDTKRRVTTTDLTNNYSWVKNYTAVGDSYSAGIGAGVLLHDNNDDEGVCQRFSGAYPIIVNDLLGADITRNFQFIACSGAVSSDIQDPNNIRQQIAWLPYQSQDLVTVTAGGNDALLTALLKDCIYTPTGKPACDKAQQATRKVIDDDLQKNIRTMLRGLKPKMATNGLVVYTLYAQFFNPTTDACSHQTWNWFRQVGVPDAGNMLTQELREKLNTLVVEANKKIVAAIHEMKDMNIEIVEWDQYSIDNHGRFCEEGSKDDYEDPSNAGMLFTRLDTGYEYIPPGSKFKARSTLERRRAVPQTILESFHPNILGHTVIAGKVMKAIEDGRLKISKDKRWSKCAKPEITSAKCLKRDLGAPQRDDDGKPSLDTTVRQWCKEKQGKDLTASEDSRIYSHYEYKTDHSFWLGAARADGTGCSDSDLIFIDKEDCVHTLLEGMAFCDPNSGESHGMVAEFGCVKYLIDVGHTPQDESTTDEDSPTQEQPEAITCNKGDNPNPTMNIREDDYNKMRDVWCKNSTVKLPTASEYSKSLVLNFKRSDETCLELEDDCKNNLDGIWSRCSAEESNQVFLYGKGEADGTCGHYSVQVKSRVTRDEEIGPDGKVIEPKCGHHYGIPVSKGEMPKEIEKFCSENEGEKVNGVYLKGNSQRGNTYYKVAAYAGGYDTWYGNGGSASYDTWYKDASVCDDFEKEGKLNKDHCIYGLTQAWEHCTGSDGDKDGSDVGDYKYKCVQYTAYATWSK